MEDKLKNIIVTISFLFIIVVMFIANIVKEDIDVSITERRKLQLFPKFSLNSLTNGTFIDKFEDYTMDQFIKRDGFRKLKTIVEFNIFGKKDVNDLYKYNDSIIKQEYPLNEKSVLNICNKINAIKEQYLDESNSIYYSIVPDKNYFVEDEYLKMDYSKLENIMSQNLSNMKYIDILDLLELEDYYYTDTHWKQENLQNVLDKIANDMDFSERIQTGFSVKEITQFDGVYSGQLQLDTKRDFINVLTNDVIENAKVYNYETNEYKDVYNLDKLESNDRYDIYLSGATPLLKIENDKSATEKELVVFRDSFGSSLIPLFIEAYKSITVVDTRYIAPSMLGEFVDFENKDVLFIYSTLVINSSSAMK